MKISIVDYGVGNLHSLIKAFEKFTPNITVTDNKDEILASNALVLPGVGAYAAGMQGLQVRGLVEAVKEFAAEDKPILGICLGAQILLSKGYEFGETKGLDLVPGKVVKFPDLPKKEKVPQIGWNEIYPTSQGWDNTILNNLPAHPSVYFVHSFILEPDNQENILAKTNYDDYEFCAAIRQGNIYGCQFHPEKSGELGLKIIKNFINII